MCECTICCLGVSEWLYEMVAVRSTFRSFRFTVTLQTGKVVEADLLGPILSQIESQLGNFATLKKIATGRNMAQVSFPFTPSSKLEKLL